MAHSAGSLNLTKALYKRLLHGGVLGGVSICIYIYCIPMNPLSSRTQWLGLRGSTQVSSMPQPRGQLPQHPSPRCDKEEDFCRPPRGHDTVMARSTVNDLVINKRWLGAPRMSMNLRILRMLWGLLHMKIGGDLSRVLLLAFKLTLVVSRWVWFFTKETSCKMSVVWQILVE